MKVRSVPETTELGGLDLPAREAEPAAAPRSGAPIEVHPAEARCVSEHKARGAPLCSSTTSRSRQLCAHRSNGLADRLSRRTPARSLPRGGGGE